MLERLVQLLADLLDHASFKQRDPLILLALFLLLNGILHNRCLELL